MGFKRNEKFDDLILKVKEDKKILNTLDYEELDLFIEYLIDLSNYLKEKGE